MKPIVGSLAIRRQGDPMDLVDACLFLCDAPARMTGHLVDVDGGQVFRA
jgi:NAD(P)-dependent dehydrogenase (short-subunit alcohol dehydrogenase family)